MFEKKYDLIVELQKYCKASFDELDKLTLGELEEQ